jgi:hypothetical protein
MNRQLSMPMEPFLPLELEQIGRFRRCWRSNKSGIKDAVALASDSGLFVPGWGLDLRRRTTLRQHQAIPGLVLTTAFDPDSLPLVLARESAGSRLVRETELSFSRRLA